MRPSIIGTALVVAGLTLAGCVYEREHDVDRWHHHGWGGDWDHRRYEHEWRHHDWDHDWR